MFDFSRGFARLGLVLLVLFEAVMLYAFVGSLIGGETGMAIAVAIFAAVVPAAVIAAWRAVCWILRGFVRG